MGEGDGQEPPQSPGCSQLHSVLLPAVLCLLIAVRHLEAVGPPLPFSGANVTGFWEAGECWGLPDIQTLGWHLCSSPVPGMPLCSCVGKR